MACPDVWAGRMVFSHLFYFRRENFASVFLLILTGGRAGEYNTVKTKKSTFNTKNYTFQAGKPEGFPCFFLSDPEKWNRWKKAFI